MVTLETGASFVTPSRFRNPSRHSPCPRGRGTHNYRRGGRGNDDMESSVASRSLSGRRFIHDLVRQPRRDREGYETHETVKDELDYAAVRTPRAVKQFARDEPDRADDQHPGNRVNSFDVEQNIIHRAQH